MRASVLPTTLLLALVAAACGRGGASEGEEGHGEEGHGEEGHGEEGHGEEHEEGVVTIAPEAVTRSGIKVEKVKVEHVRGAIEVPAEIQLNPDRVAHVNSPVEGQVATVTAVVGARVTKGKVLATVRSATLGDARADLSRAQAARSVAREKVQRQEALEREGIGARRSLVEANGELAQAEAEVRAAQTRLGVYGTGGAAGGGIALKSPMDGVIVERHATPGELADPEKTLFVVADVSRVWVIGRVYERDVAAARKGAPTTITLEAFPGKEWEGTVAYVADVLDDATRTLAIRVELDNPDGTLRPGLFGLVRLPGPDDARVSAPVVPEAAVQEVEEKTVVFIPGDEPGEFRTTPIEIASRGGGKVAIKSGLKAGDPVVVEGAFTLKSELMKGEMGEGHAH